MSIVREILRSDRLVLREITVADLPALEPSSAIRYACGITLP